MIIQSQSAMTEKIEIISEKASVNRENIEVVRRLVSNGLSDKITQISTEIKTFCEETGTTLTSLTTRVESLEQFKWFRDAITKLRDNVWWSLLKVLSIIILLLIVIHMTGQDVTTLLSRLLR
jgi:hypothetical protein